jgi:hypothetical protein
MGDEGSIQDLEGELHDFLLKFHADNENAKQRIRKVNNINYFICKSILLFLDRSIYFPKKISYVLFFTILFHQMNVNFLLIQ